MTLGFLRFTDDDEDAEAVDVVFPSGCVAAVGDVIDLGGHISDPSCRVIRRIWLFEPGEDATVHLLCERISRNEIE